MFAAPSSALVAGVQAIFVAALLLALGYLVADAVTSRWQLDGTSRLGLAFPGLIFFVFVLMLVHMVTRGALFAAPVVVRLVTLVVVVGLVARKLLARANAANSGHPGKAENDGTDGNDGKAGNDGNAQTAGSGSGGSGGTVARTKEAWLIAGLVAAAVLIWSTPVARLLPLAPAGDNTLHTGWASQLLSGEATPNAPITGDIPNYYPWMYHALLAVVALFTPGGRALHALGPLQVLLVAGGVLALYALGKELTGKVVTGAVTVLFGALAGGIGFVLLNGIDVLIRPRGMESQYLGDLLFRRSYNLAFHDIVPPYPREVAFVLLFSFLLLLLIGLKNGRMPALVAAGVVLGLVGLTGGETAIFGFLVAVLVPALVRAGSGRPSATAAMSPSSHAGTGEETVAAAPTDRPPREDSGEQTADAASTDRPPLPRDDTGEDATDVASVERRGRLGRIGSAVATLGPALAIYGIWLVPLAVSYIQLGGFVDITRIPGVVLGPFDILGAWGVATPLALYAVARLVLLQKIHTRGEQDGKEQPSDDERPANSAGEGTRGNLAGESAGGRVAGESASGRFVEGVSGDASVRLLAVALVAAVGALVLSELIPALLGPAFDTLGRNHRYWPLVYLPVALLAALGMTSLVQRSPRPAAVAVAVIVVALAVPSPVIATLAVMREVHEPPRLARALRGENDALLNVIVPEAGMRCVAAVPGKGLQREIFSYAGYRLVEYTAVEEPPNRARVRWDDIYHRIPGDGDRDRANRVLTQAPIGSEQWKAVADDYDVDVVVRHAGRTPVDVDAARRRQTSPPQPGAGAAYRRATVATPDALFEVVWLDDC